MQQQKYNIIYVDFPWLYLPRKNSKTLFGLGMSRYKGMTYEEVIAFCSKIKDIAAPNCALFLWHCPPKYVQYPLKDIMDACDFRYITKAFTWIKVDKKGIPRLLPGYYTGSNSEDCFLGLKGKMKVQDKGVRQVVVAPLTQHSEKPTEVRDRIVQLFGDLPRIELFARQRVEGWDAFGDQVEGSIKI
jgi:N6-adenosine-specific RNA methylase IME4